MMAIVSARALKYSAACQAARRTVAPGAVIGRRLARRYLLISDAGRQFVIKPLSLASNANSSVHSLAESNNDHVWKRKRRQSQGQGEEPLQPCRATVSRRQDS